MFDTTILFSQTFFFMFLLVDRVKKQSEDDSGGLTDNESGSGEYVHVPVEEGD